jgi:Na+/pantothenate symporter
MNFTKNIGMLLLAIFLIVYGIITLFPAIVIHHMIMGLLALVAGILILIGR